MASTEPARHALYSELERILGPEHARTLMTHLPQHPSDEAATKADLAGMESRLDRRFEGIDERFEGIDERFEGIDERFERIDERFEGIDERFERMEARFEARFERMEIRFDRLEERMDRMQRFYVATTVGSMTALTAIFSLVVGFLR